MARVSPRVSGVDRVFGGGRHGLEHTFLVFRCTSWTVAPSAASVIGAWLVPDLQIPHFTTEAHLSWSSWSGRVGQVALFVERPAFAKLIPSQL